MATKEGLLSAINGSDGDFYQATDSPNPLWVKQAGVWRPLVASNYLGSRCDGVDFPVALNGCSYAAAPGALIFSSASLANKRAVACFRSWSTAVGSTAKATLSGLFTPYTRGYGADQVIDGCPGFGLFLRCSSTGRMVALTMNWQEGSYPANSLLGWSTWSADNNSPTTRLHRPPLNQAIVNGFPELSITRLTSTTIGFNIRCGPMVDLSLGYPGKTWSSIPDVAGSPYDQVGIGFLFSPTWSPITIAGNCTCYSWEQS